MFQKSIVSVYKVLSTICMEHSVGASVDVNKDSKMRTKRDGPKEGERDDGWITGRGWL